MSQRTITVQLDNELGTHIPPREQAKIDALHESMPGKELVPGEDYDLCMPEIDFDVYYEPADREVGIMSGGYVLDSGCVDTCPDCGHIFTSEEQKAFEKAAEQKAEDLRPDIDEPDYPEY